MLCRRLSDLFRVGNGNFERVLMDDVGFSVSDFVSAPGIFSRLLSCIKAMPPGLFSLEMCSHSR